MSIFFAEPRRTRGGQRSGSIYLHPFARRRTSSEALGASKEVGEMLEEQDREGRMVAAVCAAPTALASHKIGVGSNVTSYPAPAFIEKLESAGYKYMDDNVVVDKNIVTSRGPGTSFNFALEIVKILVSQEKSEEVRKAMLVE